MFDQDYTYVFDAGRLEKGPVQSFVRRYFATARGLRARSNEILFNFSGSGVSEN